ncbi:MAG: HAD-IC family P-type ATPase [Bacilli bacterium]|nr:HAD-IC family P-type ATPase [Bacilli bacterium]
MKKTENRILGLSIEAVNERYAKGLYNQSTKSNLKSVAKIVSDNLFSYFNLILTLLAILLISIGSYENLFFVIVMLLNTGIGTFQELKARSTIKRLSLLSQPTATVLREGITIEIPIEKIVIDDICLLESGKQIVADAEVLEGFLSVNEANLTGESEPMVKQQTDKVYSGSYVISGNAMTRIIAVGKDNYIETLSAKVKTLSHPKSVILGSLKRLLKLIGIIIIPLGLMTFYNVYMQSTFDYLPDFLQVPELYQNALKKMAGSMVAMVPSGLFLLTTITFASSVVKLGKHKTLVQELYSVETLARIDTICLDKTGTLTDGSMEVEATEPLGETEDSVVHTDYDDINYIIASMNYALKEKNPTGIALAEYFGIKRKYRAKSILPFSSENKFSAVTFDKGTYVIGAPEMIFKGKYGRIRKHVEKQARKGKRVLLLANAKGFEDQKLTGPVSAIALILLNDHVRDSAFATLTEFYASGVNIKIISGDNHLTAADVAKRAGVKDADKSISLAGLSDEEVIAAAHENTVFGRVKPEQKRLLIRTLQTSGSKVAMVGDGVNDILALKAADCSIAMTSGSESARNISHLVLLDNDFASLPKVVKEGRQIVNNLERASVLYLVKTVYTILLTIILLLTRNIYPFEPVHMFVIETFIIGIPSFFIALEPNESRFHGSFLRNVFKNVIPGALLIVLNLLGVYVFARFWPSITDGEISTVGIIAATFAYLLVLVNVTTPLNRNRSIIVISAGIASAFCFIVLGQTYFKLEQMSVPSVLLLILLMETTYVLMSIAKKQLVKFWV